MLVSETWRAEETQDNMMMWVTEHDYTESLITEASLTEQPDLARMLSAPLSSFLAPQRPIIHGRLCHVLKH